MVTLVTSPECMRYAPPNSPEQPARLSTIIEKLKQTGVWEICTRVEGVPCAIDDLYAVHDADYVTLIKENSVKPGQDIGYEAWVGPSAFDAALASAGCALAALRHVLTGVDDVAFSLARPPGHHARPNEAMGFCIFNNAALAAAYAVAEFGLQRVMIVDFDVHHGNGTQEMFYDRSDVLYYSLHQHPQHPPGRMAYPEAVGEGDGVGFNINVLLPDGRTDADYVYAIQNTLAPTVHWYKPELIIVSAGFDAHHADPLSRMQITEDWYAWMAEQLHDFARTYCDNRLVIILEGGYHLDYTPCCISDFVVHQTSNVKRETSNVT